MNQIVNSFFKNFNRVSTVLPNSNLVVAFSGGQDSSTLLLFFTIIKSQFQLNSSLVYCNHLWITEALFIQYSLLQITFIFPQKFYIAIPFDSIPTELNSRSWRYCIFQRILYLSQTKNLITGHTKSDQIETFFINLIKGSGVRSVTTLLSKRYNYWPQSACFSEKKTNIQFTNFDTAALLQVHSENYSSQLIRPLLFLNRYEITLLIEFFLFPVWSDKTNINLNFFRNRIRHILLPTLRFYFFSRFDNAISRYLDILQAEFKFFDSLTNQLVLFNNKNNSSTTRKNCLSYDLVFFLSLPYIYQKRIIIQILSLLTKKRLSLFFVLQLIQLIQIVSKTKKKKNQPKIFLISKNVLLIFFNNKFYFQKSH